ncbi:MAG: hypothetical protein HY841_02595 [Bacteroidetes bacterium]|nr:hypothetical protein [Bacteroidota bacterium]
MKIKITISFLLLYFVLSQYSILKSQVSLQDSIYNLFIDFIHSPNEAKKNDNSKKFSDGLKAALNMNKSNEFSFDSLKKYRVLLESPDKQVRIFTWDIQAEDVTHTYYGFVQAYNRKSKKYVVYELKDKSETIKDPENASLDNTKWFGAYYYQIAEVKYKKKKQYVLLGWDGNNRISNKRVIDVLYFDSKGFPKFGDAIFTDEKGKIKKRIVFEYQAGVFMSLRYDEDKQVIVFDHLSPSNPNLEGQYEFYGPDFSYDMLRFMGGKWQYIKNVDARNDKDKTDKYFNPPK